MIQKPKWGNKRFYCIVTGLVWRIHLALCVLCRNRYQVLTGGQRIGEVVECSITGHHRLLPIHHHVGVWFRVPSHFNHVPHLHQIANSSARDPALGTTVNLYVSLSMDSLPSCPIELTCQ